MRIGNRMNINNFKLNTILSKIKQDKNFHEILSGSAISFIAKIIGIVVGLVLNLVIARYYGAEELGAYSIISSLFSVALMLSVLGINTSILRLLPEQIVQYSYNSAYSLFWKVFKIVLLSSSFVAVITYMFSEEIANNIFHKQYLFPLLTLASFVIVFQSLGNVSLASIRALKNIKLYAFFQIFSPILQLLVLTILTIFFFQKFNAVYALMFSYSLSGMVVFYALMKLFSNKRVPSDVVYTTIKTKQILQISLPMMITTAMGLIVTQTDVLMLGAMSTVEEVAIYAIAMKLAMLTTFVLTSINVIIAPKISELYYSGQLDELKKLIKKTTRLIFFTSLPIVLILILFGKHILLLFGEEFVIGYTVMVLLLLAQSISMMSGPVEFFLNMTGHQKNLNYITIFSAFLNIILNYLLIPIYGFMGAAFASMISLILMKLIIVLYIKVEFKFVMMYIPMFGVKNAK